jgi:pimeloyl-ACP methyl ester carboxylesterase
MTMTYVDVTIKEGACSMKTIAIVSIDDVAATQRALAQQDGPAILVGHSWAGVVITQAGMDPKVAGLVYVAAFGPDQGEAARALAATQRPIAASAFGAQVSGVAWKTKPSWYIVSKLDSAIAPDEERFFAKRMKATTTELSTSHLAMLSQPKAVATVIMDAAAKAPVAGR